MLALDGEQSGVWQYAESNTTPFSAMRAMLGVSAVPPYVLNTDAQSWSHMINSIFGRAVNISSPFIDLSAYPYYYKLCYKVNHYYPDLEAPR